MIRKVLPLLLGLVGLGLGAGAGYVFRPTPELGPDPVAAPAPDTAQTDAHGPDAEALHEYARLANQFIVPVLVNGKVSALMVLSLSLEVSLGATPEVDAAEPKLRDVFLQILFDHANAGGFDGSYTDAANLVGLRAALREAAKTVLGNTVSDVLITDIMRRDG